MNRIDRVTAILIQLQSKKIVKAQEIANRFSISLRTVYRDINTLNEAGIPLIGEPGIGYSIMDGYRLPPIMFTKEEATAFLMAEKIVEKYTDPYNSNKFKSAMYKIRAVLRSSEKEFLEETENNILVLSNNNYPVNKQEDHSLQDILIGISTKKIIQIHYTGIYNQEETERNIEPIGIFLQNNLWYLIAYCRLRKDYRNFRVDHIRQLKIKEESFDTQHPSLKEYLDKTSKEKDLYTVIISVDKSIISHIVSQKYYFGFVSEVERGDQVEMTFLTASLEGFARWYIIIAANARIIQPGSMKERIKELISQINEKL